jgi:hypothetical protein
MDFHAEEWARKGATLSDKTARSEFGLTQDEIIAAIDAGKLQYRTASMHGSPWLRLPSLPDSCETVRGLTVSAALGDKGQDRSPGDHAAPPVLATWLARS